MRNHPTLLLSLFLVVAMGCGKPAEDTHEHDENEEQHDGDESHEEEAGVEPAGEPRVVHLEGVRGIAFGTVGAPIEEGVWLPGEAMADESERAMLSAPIAGVVASLLVSPGQEVAAGTPLVTIRSPELAELSASWLARSANRKQAAAEEAREQRLATAGAGSARELEAAQAALAVADAELAAARLALEAHGVTPGHAGATVSVRAPRRGRVAEYSVLAGQGVDTGEKLGLFEVGSGTLVGVQLSPPGPPNWVPGSETTVRRSDGKSWTARVEGLPTSLSAQTQRLSFRLRLLGGEPPYPGTPLEVRVPLPRGIVVPQGAIQQIEGEWGVFVVDGGEATFRPVRRGPELGGDVIVLDGLTPGQRIATEGAYLLKALLLKQSGEGEAHAH
jgi:cobalt-zinc-cadmium efflux system membrane fusion protein